MDDCDSNPWHQRFVLVRKLRKLVRNTFFNITRAAARTDDGRSIVRDTLDDLVSWRPANLPPGALHHEVPYTDLGRARPDRLFAERRPVFITARFRSGSTLLWRLFRSCDACTAYYEPFNERRWFDAARRGTRLDLTHRHVDDYWREYDGLGDLGQYYDENWTRRNLYMD